MRKGAQPTWSCCPGPGSSLRWPTCVPTRFPRRLGAAPPTARVWAPSLAARDNGSASSERLSAVACRRADGSRDLARSRSSSTSTTTRGPPDLFRFYFLWPNFHSPPNNRIRFPLKIESGPGEDLCGFCLEAPRAEAQRAGEHRSMRVPDCLPVCGDRFGTHEGTQRPQRERWRRAEGEKKVRSCEQPNRERMGVGGQRKDEHG